jgi:hypothetical protein
VTQGSFQIILNLIKDDFIFQNKSTCPQAPVERQLLIALKRLGSKGSSASAAGIIATSQFLGIEEGTQVLYTKRVCAALGRLFKQFVHWPNQEERMATKLRLCGAEEGTSSRWALFENCIGIIDGTLIPFRTNPRLDRVTKVAYFNYQKKRYGLNALIVCDDQ